jgi:hypothetical protein
MSANGPLISRTMPTRIGSSAGTDEVSTQPTANIDAVNRRFNIALLQRK